MLFTRSDGRLVRTMPGMQKISSYIMRSRAASINYFQYKLDTSGIDQYITDHEVDDRRTMSAMHIIIAAMVRTIAQRPQLNRFIMHNRVYARNQIVISFVVHRSLRIEDGGTTVKIAFNGTESLQQIVDAVNEAVARETAGMDVKNSTDRLVDWFMNFPAWILRPLIAFVMKLDDYNLLPQAVLDASPFHVTLFLTNLKSIGIDSVYHHQYEFGTNGLFLSMGKEQPTAVANANGTVSVKRMMNLNLSLDERFCDGLYFAKSFKLLTKYLREPSLLEEPLDAIVEDMP